MSEKDGVKYSKQDVRATIFHELKRIAFSLESVAATQRERLEAEKDIRKTLAVIAHEVAELRATGQDAVSELDGIRAVAKAAALGVEDEGEE